MKERIITISIKELNRLKKIEKAAIAWVKGSTSYMEHKRNEDKLIDLVQKYTL